MSIRPLFFLGCSCVLALALAMFTFSSGAGFFASLLVYSLGGSSMLVMFSALSFFSSEFSERDGSLGLQQA